MNFPHPADELKAGRLAFATAQAHAMGIAGALPLREASAQHAVGTVPRQGLVERNLLPAES